MISKRRLLARVLEAAGVLRTLEALSGKPTLLVINHHRIGDPTRTCFDRGVFSATQEQFDRQLEYLRRHFPIVCGDELEELASGKRPLTRTHAAITFDDGYLDNYQLAFPVLRAHGVGAAFFLVSDYVGSACVPWWDEIAYLLRATSRPELDLELTGKLAIPTAPNRETLIRTVLRSYKQADEAGAATLLQQIRDQIGCSLPPSKRRFLNWNEAREMARAGMVIGSHTVSHRVLGRLSPEEQERELTESRRNIEANIGFPVSSLAYPVGTVGTFNSATERIALSAGYTTCFSFYGGRNLPGHLQFGNLLRSSFSADPLLFRTETMFQRVLGRAPY